MPCDLPSVSMYACARAHLSLPLSVSLCTDLISKLFIDTSTELCANSAPIVAGDDCALDCDCQLHCAMSCTGGGCALCNVTADATTRAVENVGTAMRVVYGSRSSMCSPRCTSPTHDKHTKNSACVSRPAEVRFTSAHTAANCSFDRPDVSSSAYTRRVSGTSSCRSKRPSPTSRRRSQAAPPSLKIRDSQTRQAQSRR